jgi:hypothetical protein
VTLFYSTFASAAATIVATTATVAAAVAAAHTLLDFAAMQAACFDQSAKLSPTPTAVTAAHVSESDPIQPPPLPPLLLLLLWYQQNLSHT